jgi:hypothetical protein
MEEPNYKVDSPKKFTETEIHIFLDLLKQQGKVNNPTIEKINRCSLLCIATINDIIVSIGAIKPKTLSDFSTQKADLESESTNFEYEIGYCFTLKDYTNKGFSTKIVTKLLNKRIDSNLMASTEIQESSPMKRILEKNGFKHYGKIWKSSIHGGELGLFLRYSKKENHGNTEGGN